MAQREGQPRGNAALEQIPREAWEQFLHQFTEFNAEMPVRIEITGPTETGPRVLADHQPLLDVTLDQEAGVPLILIECGDPAALATSDRSTESFRHIIREPIALWARTTEPVGWDILEIVGQDSSVILSLGPHPASVPPQEDAEKELFQAGLSAKSAP